MIDLAGESRDELRNKTMTFQVYSFLGFRRAAWGVSEHTASTLARALRKVSGCGWVVCPIVEATIDGVDVPAPTTGIIGGMRLCDAIRDPRRVVDLAWADGN